MRKRQKSAVLFDPHGNHVAIADTLADEGWAVSRPRTMTTFEDLVESRQFSIGLVAVEQHLNDRFSEVRRVVQSSGQTEWVALTQPAMLEVQKVAEMIAENFYDYHTLPVDLERLLVTLGRLRGMTKLFRNRHEEVDDRGRYGMVGCSQVMQNVFRQVNRLAQVDASVLIHGESGTGKELVARAIHNNSARKHGPFIAANCSALSGELIQSQLFGHRKGAFTGAHTRQTGLVEAAQDGTIFLDEIGDLPINQQGAILRFLQEGEVTPVGASRPSISNTRVLMATNVDLSEAVREGRMRQDLFYRINSAQVSLPPLRLRDGDIIELAKYFYAKFSHEKSKKLRGFSSSAFHAMNEYSWPGNVRELMNVIRNAIILSDGRHLQPADLGLQYLVPEGRVLTLGRARAEAEIRAIKDALLFASDNVSQAAVHLEITRVTLHRLIRKYRIRR